MTATKRKPKPITANPLFPFVTGLWFATLLGLGSFATAPMLLEGPVVALGIPALVPATAPPLGFTTRILFAVAMLGFGAFFGYGLGRFLGREKNVAAARTRGFGKKPDAAPATQVRRPINAAEDLGAPLDTPVEQEAPARRRPLTQTETQPPFATPAFLATPAEEAPVPAGKPAFAEKQIFQPAGAASAAPPAVTPADPLDLDLLLEQAQVIEPAPMALAHPPFAAPLQAPLPPVAPVAQAIPAEPVAPAPQAEPAPVSPPMFAKAEEAPPSPAPEQQVFIQPSPVTPALAPATPEAGAPKPQEAFLQARAVDATPLDRTPLEDLGLVPLIERLALAISRRKPQDAFSGPAPSEAPEGLASAPASAPALQTGMARFEKSPGVPPVTESPFLQPVVQPAPVAVTAEPERVVQLRPAALQAFAAPDVDDEAEDETQDAGLERFLRMSPLLSRKTGEVAEAFGVTSNSAPESALQSSPEPEVAEERYPSLLDMAPAVVRREPLRIDDSAAEDHAVIEPVVVFPGQEAPWQQEAAKAAPAPFASARPFERPFERSSVIPVPGSPLASPGRAAPSPHAGTPGADQDLSSGSAGNGPLYATPDAEEADRALRAALETLQRMTARG